MSTRLTILFITLLFIIISCNKQKQRTAMLPNVGGLAGEVVLVINSELWKTEVGEEFRKTLQKGIEALPRPEPMFDLIIATPGAFNELMKIHRNIIMIDISNEHQEPKLIVQKDVWAKPQVVLRLFANSETSLVSLINQNSQKIQSVFLDAERNRFMNYYKKYEEKDIRDELLKKHKLALIVPKGYSIDVDKGNFIWIAHETPDINQNIFIYYYNYTDTNTFTLDYLINKRNDFLRKYVPGPKKGSYMTTEMKYPPAFQEVSYKNKYFAQIKGLWKVENYFMGGPFINFTTLDEKRNRVVTVEGVVYGPQSDKRDFLRQLESILLTLEFPE